MIRLVRSLAPYLWGAVILGLLYLVYTGASRFLDNNRAEQAIQKRQGRKYDALGTGPAGFRILQFYANSGEITRGEHIVVCYGVQDAQSVRVDPPVEKIEPAANRCFPVEPTATTTYTLIAESKDGNTEQAAFTVKVNPPAPSFLFVSISDQELRRGEPFSLCYGLKDAHSARLDPVGMKLAVGEKQCIQFFPSATAKYVLTATGEGGRTSKADFALTVK